ncbi:Histone-lysine N-methyltransferase setd2 [Rhizophlyctis rosea]|nr:Histone-lysine N-methyltransferase setd2 [Rhizophlyctis rosea]
MASTSHAVLVKNMPLKTARTDIQTRFQNHGRILYITYATVAKDGSCHVYFRSQREAQTAVKKEDNMLFNGRLIRVAIDDTATNLDVILSASSTQHQPQQGNQHANADVSGWLSRMLRRRGTLSKGTVRTKEEGEEVESALGNAWSAVRVVGRKGFKDVSLLVMSKRKVLTDGEWSLRYLWGKGVVYGLDQSVMGRKVEPLDINCQAVRCMLYVSAFSTTASLLPNNNIHGPNRVDNILLRLATDKLSNISHLHTASPTYVNMPYDPKKGYSVAVVRRTPQIMVYLKGIPEVVLARCDKLFIGNDKKPEKFTEEHRQGVTAMLHRMRRTGHSVIGFAALPLKGVDYPRNLVFTSNPPNFRTTSLTFFGMVAIKDSIKMDMVEKIQGIKGTNIQLAMLTADHPDTAIYIAKKLGIISEIPATPSSSANDASSTPAPSSFISVDAHMQHFRSMDDEDLSDVFSHQDFVVGNANDQRAIDFIRAAVQVGHTVAVVGKKLRTLVEDIDVADLEESDDGDEFQTAEEEGSDDDDGDEEVQIASGSLDKGKGPARARDVDAHARSDRNETAAFGEGDQDFAKRLQAAEKEKDRRFDLRKTLKILATGVSEIGSFGMGGASGASAGGGGDDEEIDEHEKDLLTIPVDPSVGTPVSSLFTPITSSIPIGNAKGRAKDPVSGTCHCDGVTETCGPNDGCSHRTVFWECSTECKAGERCQNQRLRRKQWKQLEIFKAGEKGLGVRALEDIAAGELVSEYVGELLDAPEFEKRKKEYSDANIQHFYFLHLGNGETIDSLNYGNASRLFNHSCSPNMRLEKWGVGRSARVAFYAVEGIKAGTELCFDYQMIVKEQQICACRSEECRGFIGASASKKAPDVPQIPHHREDEENNHTRPPTTLHIRQQHPHPPPTTDTEPIPQTIPTDLFPCTTNSNTAPELQDKTPGTDASGDNLIEESVVEEAVEGSLLPSNGKEVKGGADAGGQKGGDGASAGLEGSIEREGESNAGDVENDAGGTMVDDGMEWEGVLGVEEGKEMLKGLETRLEASGETMNLAGKRLLFEVGFVKEKGLPRDVGAYVLDGSLLLTERGGDGEGTECTYGQPIPLKDVTLQPIPSEPTSSQPASTSVSFMVSGTRRAFETKTVEEAAKWNAMLEKVVDAAKKEDDPAIGAANPLEQLLHSPRQLLSEFTKAATNADSAIALIERAQRGLRTANTVLQDVYSDLERAKEAYRKEKATA